MNERLHYFLDADLTGDEGFVLAFLKLSELRSYQPGSFLYRQGVPFEHFYLILEGIAEVYQTSANGIKKNFGIISHGCLLGVSSLDGFVQHDTIRCKTPVLAAVMPRENIALWSREMLVALIRVQTDKSRNLLKQLVCEHIEPAAARVARLLLETSSPYRYFTNPQIPAQVTFSKQEIAESVGVTRERVQQILHKMERDGAILQSKGAIIYYPGRLMGYIE